MNQTIMINTKDFEKIEIIYTDNTSTQPKAIRCIKKRWNKIKKR